MDDSCAVCADTLEWVAYGSCGHRDVCSTCVARLRFICGDRRCCICKSESAVVFVTKALGDYTRTINDFTVFPSEPREGRAGSYWYHEDTQAFFDDVDHYKMIKAMCRLSCSVCDKIGEDQPNDGPKRRGKFRNIEQLKGHLFHRHKLFMCSLCLEGRKIFICEQKLYSRAQLNQHINTGDSEVDGSESERGGFTGHPMCEFCRTPFYGDNELYTHMSTEHYTCHICQRLHPGQYEYYKNYDDLEIHFRQAHFLCEDEACLAKKFIVFQSEGEMKRHNTIEHGGKLSRSKRNAALQIPTSFRYRRSNEQDNRRGRRTFRRDSSDDLLSLAIQASFETGNADDTNHDPLPSSSFSSGQVASDQGNISNIDPLIEPFESLATTDPESASRYLQALGHSRNSQLEQSSFPPLSTAPSSSHPKPMHDKDASQNNSMAAHLRRQRKVTVLNSAQGWPKSGRAPVLPSNNSSQAWPAINVNHAASSSSGQAKGVVTISNGPSVSGYSNSAQMHGKALSSSSSGSSSSGQTKGVVTISNGPSVSGYSNAAQVQGKGRSSSSSGLGSSSRISHSASAPSLTDIAYAEPSVNDFPPVSAAQARKAPSSSQSSLNVEDVQTANKSLVEKIRAALDFDQDRYAVFKDISAQYRQGLIETQMYLDCVQQFGLSHLVLELARLCPDAQKQKELVETYNASLQKDVIQENGRAQDGIQIKDKSKGKKGKGKYIDAKDTSSKDKLADSILSSVRELQSNFMPSEEEVEVLSKGEYRAAKGKSKLSSDEQQGGTGGQNSQPSTGLSNQNNTGDGGGGSKQKKKTSKFHRVRLGDGSVAALLDLKNPNPASDPDPVERIDDNNSGGGVPVRGVWRNGAQKLFS
ncbi:E3 ubiquitin-protein ligase HEL2 [Momordica charantia]|uniref:RING-type E3 ubiquitin transferase n=1 Tax=Momordica charantia TaxID=3673 RepID=A0A6J1D4L3_MOMCH|nr:E3 ubiquitin-protein ligase HEL2 [Momordica charantia]